MQCQPYSNIVHGKNNVIIVIHADAASVDYNCPVNSTYLRCSDIFPICLVNDYVCDKIADCYDAVDEIPEQCGHGKQVDNDVNVVNKRRIEIVLFQTSSYFHSALA